MANSNSFLSTEEIILIASPERKANIYRYFWEMFLFFHAMYVECTH